MCAWLCRGCSSRRGQREEPRRPANAALARAVDAGENIEARRVRRAHSKDNSAVYLSVFTGGPAGRASELGRGGVERGCHRLFGLSGLHTIQQIVEFGAEVFESARLYLHQRLEFFVRKQHGFWAPCRVIAAAPLRVAFSRIEPNSFLTWVALTVGMSTSEL